MTVCIAAVAANAKAVVLVADKAISAIRGGQTVFKAETGVRKIRTLTDNWAALISGPIDFGEQVAFNAERKYQEARHPPRGDIVTMERQIREEILGIAALLPTMPECAKAAFQAERRIHAIDRILHARALTQEWFDERVKNPIPRDDAFFRNIIEEIRTFITESCILLCGFEEGSPEIYILSDPGVLNSASAEGFGVVGIGEDIAKNRLYTLETDPHDAIEKVLYDAYDAKESCAEFLPDVGHEWNAVIMVEGKPAVEVPEDIMDIIEDMYEAHPKSPFGEKLKLPKNWQKRLAEFSKPLCGEAVVNPMLTERNFVVAP